MRRRSQNKTIAISITLDRSIIDELDEILSPKQSRSKFIQTAITNYLSATNMTIHNWSIEGIIAHLLNSRNLTPGQKDLLILLSKSL